jgi:hypothetical protein
MDAALVELFVDPKKKLMIFKKILKKIFQYEDLEINFGYKYDLINRNIFEN